ncbi:hypothetical protein dsat_2062 [Alkalidesulfovibrio alkalitolerans DSM 16529]|uniref:Uncharacterized protein n=1 Tax=Alkalidesulfovibrio alkalitolerans DSM 16529 TaxID=1121439 RepID=S7TF65_9BACT|nr:hypothetical protein dsat_2062 [Alkalidesulfovibrio alkalitolerans DSM 16529]
MQVSKCCEKTGENRSADRSNGAGCTAREPVKTDAYYQYYPEQKICNIFVLRVISTAC